MTTYYELPSWNGTHLASIDQYTDHTNSIVLCINFNIHFNLVFRMEKKLCWYKNGLRVNKHNFSLICSPAVGLRSSDLIHKWNIWFHQMTTSIYIYLHFLTADLFRSDGWFRIQLQLWWRRVEFIYFFTLLYVLSLCYFVCLRVDIQNNVYSIRDQLNEPLDNLNCSTWLNNSHKAMREMLTACCPQTLPFSSTQWLKWQDEKQIDGNRRHKTPNKREGDSGIMGGSEWGTKIESDG